MSKFVIRMVPSGVKFDLRADNGAIIATSEVYAAKAACLRGVEAVRRCAAAGKVLDTTLEDQKAPTNPRFEIFRDRRGRYRFRLRSRNGEIIAQSEPYSSKDACLDGAESVIRSAPGAEME